MHYCGSKAKLAGAMLHYMMNSIGDRMYIEPFLGGANVMCRVPITLNRYGSDYNPYIIALWKALQNGWIPPDFVTRDEYYSVKNAPGNFEPHIVGYIASVCTFSGYWWGGYRGIERHKRNGQKVVLQNHQSSARQNVLAQVSGMVGAKLSHADYINLAVPRNSLVYCDPPYVNTANDYMRSPFKHDEFWDWCRSLASLGVLVFITEYTYPPDFTPIWVETATYERGQLYGQKDVNKLVVHESQVSIVHTEPPHKPKLRVPGR